MAEPPSWDLLDEDFDDISDWNDFDSGTGESSVDPAGQLKLLTGAVNGLSYAYRRRDIGEYPNTFTVEVKIYHDALGTLANTDYAEMSCRQADEYIQILLCSDGLFLRDTDSGDTEVGTDLVKEGGSAEWQTWRFLVTFTGTTGEGTCDVYLKDTAHPNWAKVGTAIPCSKETVSTDGWTIIFQYCYTVADRITHVDYFKVATGLYAPTMDIPVAASGQAASEGTVYALLALIGGAEGQATSSGEAAALFGYVVSATGAAASQGAAAALLELMGRATGLAVTTWDIIMVNFTGDLAPGETLVIDHKAKTVTIDGVNVLKYFTTGDFPNLSPGGSTVKYADFEDSRDLTITVTYKDKWL